MKNNARVYGKEVQYDKKIREDPVDDPLRILFLGNSLMFFNDMPSLFRNLAEKAGKEVYVDSITRGSATISDFAC